MQRTTATCNTKPEFQPTPTPLLMRDLQNLRQRLTAGRYTLVAHDVTPQGQGQTLIFVRPDSRTITVSVEMARLKVCRRRTFVNSEGADDQQDQQDSKVLIDEPLTTAGFNLACSFAAECCRAF